MRNVIVFLALFGTVALAQTRTPHAPPASKAKSPAATGAPVVSETVALQVMLDRAGFSPGEIDGRTGMNLQRAIAAFQRAHGATESGQPDDQTWQQLSQGGNQTPLVAYEITSADVAGPFEQNIPSDLMQQSQLKTLNYQGALEALSERFHASPRLLQELNPGATFSTAGERIMVPNVEPFEPPPHQVIAPRPPAKNTASGRTGRGRRGAGAAAETNAPPDPVAQTPAVVIAVTKSTSALTVEDESGRVLFHAPVTSGSEHDPLPIGNWKVNQVITMPVFNYNPDLFWDANPSHSKAKIPAGPNNPVGVAWIDLSKEHYGIHGTAEPSKIGHVQSHGCVRLTNWDVKRVLQWATPGTAVVFRE